MQSFSIGSNIRGAYPSQDLGGGKAGGQQPYTVKRGDTLTSIGKRFGLEVGDLIKSNPSLKERPDLLQIGEVLRIDQHEKDVAPQDSMQIGLSTLEPLAKTRLNPFQSAFSHPNQTPGVQIRKKPGLRPLQNKSVVKTPPSDSETSRDAIYRVRKGDTLTAIGKKFGLSVSELLRSNPALQSRPDAIEIGESIRIPGSKRGIATTEPSSRKSSGSSSINEKNEPARAPITETRDGDHDNRLPTRAQVEEAAAGDTGYTLAPLKSEDGTTFYLGRNGSVHCLSNNKTAEAFNKLLDIARAKGWKLRITGGDSQLIDGKAHSKHEHLPDGSPKPIDGRSASSKHSDGGPPHNHFTAIDLGNLKDAGVTFGELIPVLNELGFWNSLAPSNYGDRHLHISLKTPGQTNPRHRQVLGLRNRP